MGTEYTTGNIYLAYCPAMPGLVKVGMTTRDPEERVAELSAATGVPTPFLLIWQVPVANPAAAERLAHETLTAAGFNRSPNREFFSAPINRALELLIASFPERLTQSSAVPEHRKPTSSAADEICALAEATFNGAGTTLRDEEEGLRLFRRAAALGSAQACLALVRVAPSRSEILSSLRRAVELGEPRAYEDMARYYEDEESWDNAAKCWKRLLRTESLTETELLDYIVTCLSSAAAEYHCGELAEAALEVRPSVFSLLASKETHFTPERWRWIRRVMDSTYSDDDYYLEGTVTESTDKALVITLSDGRRLRASFTRRFPTETRLRCLVYGNEVSDAEPLWWPT